MEDKDLYTQELTKFENYLEEAVLEPATFLSEIKKRHNKKELSSLLGYFLAKSCDIILLKETIKMIGSLQDEDNIDDLLDFLMVRDFSSENINEVINLKIICIKTLSSYKDKRCIPALLYCLNDKRANYKLRFQAAEALGKIGDKNAVESLINVVSDENEKSIYVRESAAVALGMIGDMRAIDPFLTILEAKKNFLDKFTFLKERVIEALGKIDFTNSNRVIQAFKNALNDDSPQVRINAIECLINSGEQEAYDIIKTKLLDKDEDVIKNAVVALYNLKGKEALFEIMKDENLPETAKNEATEIYREYEEDE